MLNEIEEMYLQSRKVLEEEWWSRYRLVGNPPADALIWTS
jgi:hypothetical protein